MESKDNNERSEHYDTLREYSQEILMDKNVNDFNLFLLSFL